LSEEGIEDDVHTFFTCISARFIGQVADLSSIIVSAACQQGSAANKEFALFWNEDYANIYRVATSFWSIWHNCNDQIWNDNARMPSQVGRVAFDNWNEWFVVHKM
jgi:hypothetical protein